MFNKTLEDFDNDLEAYNKYLEEVEDIVYKLDNKIDVVETEEKLRTYEELNKQLIMNNMERSKKDLENFEQRQQFEKEMRMKKRMLERQIESEDKMNKEWAKREIVNRLASSTNADDVIEGVKNTVKLKKSSARRKLEEINRVLQNNPYSSLMLSQGLSRKEDNVPFTPFNGDRDLDKRYTIDQESYDDPFIKDLENRKDYIASGFRSDFVYDRMLTEAFMGLGCVVAEEV